MKRYLLIYLFLLFSSFLFAEEIQNHSATPSEYPSFSHEVEHSNTIDSSGGQISDFQEKFFRMIYLLALLVGLMIAASWILKKMMKTRISQMNVESSIKVLETRSLSPKSILYLVEVEGKRMIIAESHLKIEKITSLD